MEWIHHLTWHHVAGGSGFVGVVWFVKRWFERRDQRDLEQRNQQWLDRILRERHQFDIDDERRRRDLGRLD